MVTEHGYERERYGWYVVSILTIAYVVSYIDRQFLGLLIGPIKQTLHLSDTQIGLLLGPAFAIFYVVLGYPIGLLADHRNRRNIVTAGMMIWCVMTSLCGLSRGFSELFLTRIGVGVGEAALNPSAFSLIGDYFSKHRRVLPMSVYTLAVSLGGGLAYLIGGSAVAWILSKPPLTIPGIGKLYTWQTAFLAVGLPGLLVAVLIMLTIREPRRHERLFDLGSAWSGLRFMAARWRAYLPTMLSGCGFTITTYNGFWNTALFQRTWGWDLWQISMALGSVLIVGGPLGTLLGGVIVRQLRGHGYRDAPLRATLIGTALIVLTNIAYPLMPSAMLAVVTYFLATAVGGMTIAASNNAIAALAPNQIKAQASAIFVVVLSIVGLSGPAVVGRITDRVFGNADALRYSLALIPIFFGPPLLLLLWWGLSPFAAGVTELEAAGREDSRPPLQSTARGE